MIRQRGPRIVNLAVVSAPEPWTVATGCQLGACATFNVTADERAARAPGAGDWLVTVPAGTPGAAIVRTRLRRQIDEELICHSMLNANQVALQKQGEGRGRTRSKPDGGFAGPDLVDHCTEESKNP
ncbi:MAG: hypothetical protein NVS2B16_28460 [Chloroflexota bacterium]